MNMAKSLMICGTGSHVGKSLITAGLCRIFKQDGYSVAPFKAQNMALNSFATKEGGEIGRAQAVQAAAAKTEPHVDMNPVLLKPSSDTGAQVIILGKVKANMNVKKYFAFKKNAFNTAKKAYNRLSKKHEIIVMEGAGSPSEINIPDDIVNLSMANHANAPVLLIGDIDLGGVFAWIIGTLDLIKSSYKKLIKGLIINKFRGDIDILKPGLLSLEKRTNRPVLGVVPYLKDLKVEEEDSVAASRFSSSIYKPKTASDKINIEILYLPHISNFTDFDSLSSEEDVNLRYVKMGESITNPDLLIIPGTKNTISDFQYLKRDGYINQIKSSIKKGAMLIGICGGFQMLGLKIIDIKGSESGLSQTEGLGLINFVTRLMPSKVVSQVKALAQDRLPFVDSKACAEKLSGYEIHIGRTKYLKGITPAFKIISRLDKETEIDDGALDSTGQVWGTYMHGIFDNDSFRRHLLNHLRAKKGLPVKESVSSLDKDKEIDKLADSLRQNLDINKIYQIIGLKPILTA